MANYVSFRGVSTASLTHVLVAQMPSHGKPEMRHTEFRVRGRDGVLHTDEGFETFDMTCVLMLWGGSASDRNVINAWADGTGKLILSDDATKCWNASVLKEIQWSRDYVNNAYYDTAKITFTCQPIMREATPTVYTVTSSTATIASVGNYESLPLIKVTGSGDCTVTLNGTEMSFSGLSSSVPVFVDCENGYVYTASGAATMTGEFPHMVIGTNSVAFSGGTTKVEITANWGWV